MIRYSTGGEGVIYFWYLKEGRLSPFWETMECSKRLYCPWILTGQDVQSSNRYKLWCTRHTFEAHWNGGIIEIGVLIGIMALINKNTFKGGGGLIRKGAFIERRALNRSFHYLFQYSQNEETVTFWIRPRVRYPCPLRRLVSLSVCLK